MTYAYIRVSTDKQNTENQHFEIEKFSKERNIKIDEWIEETISGTIEYESRRLGQLFKSFKRGDTLIITEVSRLGRNLMHIMSFLNYCMQRKIIVLTVKERYELGNNINSKILAFAFGLSAEIERNLISQRTREALARLRKGGGPIGRPIGSTPEQHKLEGKEHVIADLLQNQRVSKKVICELFNVSPQTLRKFLKKHPECDVIRKPYNRPFANKREERLWREFHHRKHLH